MTSGEIVLFGVLTTSLAGRIMNGDRSRVLESSVALIKLTPFRLLHFIKFRLFIYRSVGYQFNLLTLMLKLTHVRSTMNDNIIVVEL